MPELLEPEQMLAQLNGHGEDAESDFNDGEEVEGWFGWRVHEDVLTVTHLLEEADLQGTRPKASARWRLVPIGDEVGRG